MRNPRECEALCPLCEENGWQLFLDDDGDIHRVHCTHCHYVVERKEAAAEDCPTDLLARLDS